MKDRFWLKALLAMGLFSAAILTTFVLLYRSVVTPDPAPQELSERPIPVVIEHRAKQTGRYKIAGLVVDPDGNPVPDVRIEAFVEGDNPSWVSDPDGFFTGTLESAGSLVIPDRLIWLSVYAAFCLMISIMFSSLIQAPNQSKPRSRLFLPISAHAAKPSVTA